MSKMIKIQKGLSIDTHMVAILREMCKRVGICFIELVPFEKNERGKPKWPFDKYTWTKKQEGDFRKWVVDYLYNNSAARKALTYCGKNKKQINDAVGYILLMFGWNHEEKKEESSTEAGRQP